MTQSAGKLSPLAFVMVSLVLYLIKVDTHMTRVDTYAYIRAVGRPAIWLQTPIFIGLDPSTPIPQAVYAMAVLSFPHNGGAYNVLVNVAPRPIAALGASLTIISYIATCVVRYATRSVSLRLSLIYTYMDDNPH